jgi:hypothetical protein
MQLTGPPAAKPIVRLGSNPNVSDSEGPEKESRGAARTFVTLVWGASGMACILALLPAAGHDQLWFLLMAQRWLHGATLYGPEAFDSNTPAIVWLSAFPVWLAERLHLSLPFAGKVLMSLLEIAVAVVAWKTLSRLSARFTPAERWFLAFFFITLFAVAPARDFGQRDLLAVLLCFPYVLAAAQAPTTQNRIAIALLATIGICVKPQLALIPIVVEVAVLLKPSGRRRLRIEPLLFLASGGLFLLAIHTFAPLYLSQAIPTTLSTYWAIRHLTAAQLIRESIQLHILLAIVLLLLPRIGRIQSDAALRLRRTIAILILAGIAGMAAYYQQGTGWYYQQLPGIVLLGSAFALELIILSDDRKITTPKWLPAAAIALTVLALGLTLHFSGYPLTEDRSYAITTPDPSFFAGLAAGTPVATITTSVDDAIEPVFRYHLTWAQRTNNLWTLPAILRATNPSPLVTPPPRLTPQRLAELTAQQRLWMVEDLTRWHPKLILVERCQSPEVQCQELEDRHDNLLEFFLADPAFRQIWQQYRPLRSAGPYDAYIRAD